MNAHTRSYTKFHSDCQLIRMWESLKKTDHIIQSSHSRDLHYSTNLLTLRGTCCHHFKMKAIWSFETWVSTHLTPQHHNPEDKNLLLGFICYYFWFTTEYGSRTHISGNMVSVQYPLPCGNLNTVPKPHAWQ